MKKIIYDCDNTMGISNRDIDDGLALMYLLSRDDVQIVGITCTYGNDSVENVYQKTKELLKDIKRDDIPLIKGKGSSYVMKDYVNLDFDKECKDKKENEASKFIFDMVTKHKNEISILATGSMKNIYDALCIDDSFLNDVKEIVVMGGTTDTLYFADKIMNELNFTVCSEGAFYVLKNMKNISILTGNNCMKSRFSLKHLEIAKNRASKNHKNEFLLDKIQKWMREFKKMYNYDSIVLWDVISAIYLMEKDFFVDKYYINYTSMKDIKTGRLNLKLSEKSNTTLNLPEIKNSEMLNNHLIETIF